LLDRDDAGDLLAVQRTLQGEKAAFNELVHRYTPVVYSLSYRFLDEPEEIEEAVQEIFLKVYKSLGSFRLESRFFTWFYTVALNWLRSGSRSKKNRRKTIPFSQMKHDSREMGTDRNDPLRHFVGLEEERRARKALDGLKPSYREPFILHYQEHLPLKEIAEIMHLSEEGVKTRLFRARKQLVEKLSK